MLMHVDKMYQALPLLSGESQGTTLPMSHFALKQAGLDVMQSHPLYRTHFSQYQGSLTVQDAFQSIPGLNSHTGVTGRWGPSHARKAVCIVVRLALRS